MFQNNIAYANVFADEPDRLREADRYSEETFACLGAQPAIQSTRGTVLILLGKLDEGMILLSNALESTEQDHDRLNILAWLAIGEHRRNETKSAHEYLKMATEITMENASVQRAQHELSLS